VTHRHELIHRPIHQTQQISTEPTVNKSNAPSIQQTDERHAIGQDESLWRRRSIVKEASRGIVGFLLRVRERVHAGRSSMIFEVVKASAVDVGEGGNDSKRRAVRVIFPLVFKRDTRNPMAPRCPATQFCRCIDTRGARQAPARRFTITLTYQRRQQPFACNISRPPVPPASRRSPDRHKGGQACLASRRSRETLSEKDSLKRQIWGTTIYHLVVASAVLGAFGRPSSSAVPREPIQYKCAIGKPRRHAYRSLTGQEG
jgi:hypothetical protein